jgi:endonuclease/exonuclease/phosphatase family metal-dependent hydrolase
MGFQECKNVGWVMDAAKQRGLNGDYKTLSLVWEDRALGIAYRASRWTLLQEGHEDVGEDQSWQYYGKRAVLWGRFQHRDGLTLFFINHHGPLPVSTSGNCGGSATSYNIMRVIAENAHANDAVVLVGDFNAQAHSSRITALDGFMHRVVSGTDMGGVDHIFSNCADDAVLDASQLGNGGSDHDAISTVLRFPSPE